MATDKPGDIRALLIETVRVQLAALNAGIAFWTGWVESASEFAQTAKKELMALSDNRAQAYEVLSRITDSSRKYLDTMTELPERAIVRFRQDLGRAGGSTKGPRRRAAKAKE